MKITVITATYNSGATLRDTLESVLRQNFRDFEHIVVDGGSKDNTLAIVREYEPCFLQGNGHAASNLAITLRRKITRGYDRADAHRN